MRKLKQFFNPKDTNLHTTCLYATGKKIGKDIKTVSFCFFTEYKKLILAIVISKKNRKKL